MQANISTFTSTPGTSVQQSADAVLDFNMTWAMANPEYGTVVYGCPTCTKPAVTATPTWNYTGGEEQIETLNYEAISTMYKL